MAFLVELHEAAQELIRAQGIQVICPRPAFKEPVEGVLLPEIEIEDKITRIAITFNYAEPIEIGHTGSTLVDCEFEVQDLNKFMHDFPFNTESTTQSGQNWGFWGFTIFGKG